MSSLPIGTLDVRGVPAPVYLLHTRHAIIQMTSGQTIVVLTDLVERRLLEIKSLAAHVGFILVEQSQDGEAYRHVLQRR